MQMQSCMVASSTSLHLCKAEPAAHADTVWEECGHSFQSALIQDLHLNWRRQWHPTAVLLPGKSHGRRSLVGCSPWGGYKSDTTEQLHFQFLLSCIGEGNGNPLQCSCLENPRDVGAWWAAVHWVAQSRTRLKRLSSSSNSLVIGFSLDD